MHTFKSHPTSLIWSRTEFHSIKNKQMKIDIWNEIGLSKFQLIVENHNLIKDYCHWFNSRNKNHLSSSVEFQFIEAPFHTLLTVLHIKIIVRTLLSFPAINVMISTLCAVHCLSVCLHLIYRTAHKDNIYSLSLSLWAHNNYLKTPFSYVKHNTNKFEWYEICIQSRR